MSPAKNRVMKEKTDTASNISADVSEASDKSQKKGKGKKTSEDTEEKVAPKAESSVEKMIVEEGDTMNATFDIETSEPRETENGDVAVGDKDDKVAKADSKQDQEMTDKTAETEEQNVEVAGKQVEEEDEDDDEEEEAMNPAGKNKRKAPAKKAAKPNKRAKVSKKDDEPTADEDQMEVEEEKETEKTDEKVVEKPKEANKAEKPARGKKKGNHEEENPDGAATEDHEEKVEKPVEAESKDDDKPKEAKPERQTRGKKGAKPEKEDEEEEEEDDDDDKPKVAKPERQTRGKKGAKSEKEQPQESEDEMAEEKDKPKEAKPERQTRGKRGAKPEKEQTQESEEDKEPEPEKQTRGKRKVKLDEKKDDEEVAQVNTRQTRQKRNEDDKVHENPKGAKSKEDAKKVEVSKNQRGARKPAVVEESEDEDESEPQKPSQNKKTAAGKKAAAKTSKAKVEESEEEEEEEAPKPKRGEKTAAASKKATKNSKSKNEENGDEEPQRPKRGSSKKAATTKASKAMVDISEDEEEEEDTKPKRGAAKKATATSKGSKAKAEESDEDEVATKPKRGGRNVTAAKKAADAKNAKNKVDESEDEEDDEQELPKQKKTSAPKKPAATKASKATEDKKATSQSKTVTNDRKRKADSETKESEKQVKKAKQEHATTTPIPTRWNIPGLVLAMGSSDVGQLGLGPDLMEVSRAKRVDLGGDKVVQISAGGMHSLCVTPQGEVYSFGCNDEATLGRITEEEDDLSVPGKVEGIEGKVVQVVAGDSHSVALTEHGQVYIWGTFRDTNGVIGINPGDENLDSGKPEERRKQESGKEMGKSEKVEKPSKILRGVKVVKIAGGSAHILCLSDKGVVYSLGASDVGQLGRVGGWFSVRGGRLGIDSTLNAKPVRFNKRGLKCVDIWAGAYVSFAKTSEGEILSWGLNNYHQLGFPDIENRLFPEVSKMFDPALGWKEIACAEHHTVALDGSGRVYTIGRKDYGRLGLGSVEKLDHVDKLTLVKSLESTKCISVGCGSSVSFAVAEDGTIYGWGMGSTMQLGMGDSEEDVEEPKPIKGKDLNNLKGIMAVAGGQHTLLLASE